MDTQPRRYRSLVTPALLIILGLVFLAQNFGLVNLSIWTALLKLWPLWLILVGLDMVVGRRTAWGSWVVLGALILALGGGLTWAVNNPVAVGPGDPVTVHQQLEESVKQAKVELHSSVTQLSLHAVQDSALLVEGQINPLIGENITQEYHVSGNTAYFTVKPQGVNVGLPSFHANWDLGLSTKLPIDLVLDAGVGQSELDLRDLTLTSLEVNSGVGQINLTLPAHGNVRAKIGGGVGALNVRIPAGMAARVTAHQGLGAVDVSGTNVSKSGRTWTTQGFDQATDKVELSIDGGVGAIEVRLD